MLTWWKWEMGQLLWKKGWQVLKKLNMELPCDLQFTPG